MAILMTSCLPPGPPAPPPPQLVTIETAAKPEAAYREAYPLFARQPGHSITWADPSIFTFRGEVNNAAQMQVAVQAQGQCSLVHVSGQVMPNKLTTGQFTEVQDFANQLKGKLDACPVR